VPPSHPSISAPPAPLGRDAETWLASLQKPAADRDYRPGHSRMQAMLSGAGLRRPRLRIRIAGTNGKGSTAFMLARALEVAGLRVGLYTSPHIHCFNERIRINLEPVADTDLLPMLAEIMPQARKIGASWFEVATALALRCFSRARVDVEILEAGVGARFDATTAVPADMALITPIGLDHQVWLGPTLAAIAAEKSAAMDGCRWAVSSPQSASVRRVLLRHRPDLAFSRRMPSVMAGMHQGTNAGLAWAALRLLRAAGCVGGNRERLRRAVMETRIAGRLQPVRCGDQRLWLDAAHNMHAVRTLLPSLPSLADPFDAIFVFTRSDRDLTPAVPLLQPFTRRVVAPPGTAGVDAGYTTLEAALAAEMGRREAGSFLVLGSFTSVAAALNWCRRRM